MHSGTCQVERLDLTRDETTAQSSVLLVSEQGLPKISQNVQEQRKTIVSDFCFLICRKDLKLMSCRCAISNSNQLVLE